MGEEGKAWTSLCHCLLLETVPLKTKKNTKGGCQIPFASMEQAQQSTQVPEISRLQASSSSFL